MKPTAETKRKTAARVRSSEIVSLCEGVASKSAKRRLVKIWNNERSTEALKILEAFYIGYNEGQLAQANAERSNPAPKI